MKQSKPISEKRLAANRANARHSTGPRTAEGKAASARNSVRHGFTASTFNVVRLESLDEVAELKADLVAAYQPVNSQELLAIERMALAQQSILRSSRLEAGMFTVGINETLWDIDSRPGAAPFQDFTQDVATTRQQNRNYFAAQGLRFLTKEANSWSLLLRYQAQAERMYRRALDEFCRLKSLRADMPSEDIQNDRQAVENIIQKPNEPISRTEPRENTPDPPAATNPSDASEAAPEPPALPQSEPQVATPDSGPASPARSNRKAV